MYDLVEAVHESFKEVCAEKLNDSLLKFQSIINYVMMHQASNNFSFPHVKNENMRKAGKQIRQIHERPIEISYAEHVKSQY